MKDQRFAVAPGSHTLVGVKQYKVITFCPTDASESLLSDAFTKYAN